MLLTVLTWMVTLFCSCCVSCWLIDASKDTSAAMAWSCEISSSATRSVNADDNALPRVEARYTARGGPTGAEEEEEEEVAVERLMPMRRERRRGEDGEGEERREESEERERERAEKIKSFWRERELPEPQLESIKGPFCPNEW